MKITRTKLKKIIKEELYKEAGRSLKQVGREKRDAAGMSPHSRYQEVDFDWTPDGLSMVMSINGNQVMSFMRQKEVRALISQLESLLAGPMRTSP